MRFWPNFTSKKWKQDIYFEETAFDDWAKDFDRLELPLSRHIFFGSIAAATLVIGIVLGRVIFLNIVRGDFYRQKAVINTNREIALPASRGVIVDRFGQPLVKNIPTFSVSLRISEFFVNSGGVETDLQKIAAALGEDFEEIKKLVQRADLEGESEIIIKHDISIEQAIELRSLAISGLQVKDDYRRQYPDGPVFAHVLGYIGVAETGDAIVGKVGLEAVYDQKLRGKSGKRVAYRDAAGNILEEKTIAEPQAGYQLNTTIDADFQRYFYKRFKEGLETLGRKSGVGLAINPKTGEILSLLSFPEFDNNNPAAYLDSKDKAMFNRAISGVYSPGSTIKPFVALAALQEGVVTPVDEVYSGGFLELPNPYNPNQPSRFLDWKAHGYVNLFSALARSSNIYFYVVGGGFGQRRGLGVERLLDYWKKLNLGQKTNVDLTAESEGFFYSPEEKEKKTGEIWRIGDTYNVSIGQGNLAMTPIRLLSSFASLAVGGKEYRPFVAESFIDERGNTVQLNQPTQIADYSKWDQYIYEINKGLKDAVRQSYGTAHYLADLPVSVAAKTGSAQIHLNTATNAFFVGYAPADDPEIAILILIENSREGSLNTLPIARDVLNWYYYNRLLK